MRTLHIFLLLTIFFSSCVILTEEDLAETEVKVLIPSDQLISEERSQLFWWENMDDALDYSLQIVEGNFDSICGLILDSTIVENTYRINLEPGEYEWRIRALNYYSASIYTYGCITILDTSGSESVK